MAEVITSAILEAPAQAVWQLLVDFGGIQRWWPTGEALEIEQVKIEGSGVGMIRHIYNRGMKGCISERLELLDPGTRTLMLSIVGTRPWGITAYVAEAHVLELEAERCRMDYRANFTTEPGLEEQVRNGLLATYKVMFRGLEEAAAKSQRS